MLAVNPVAEQRHNILQGEHAITRDPNLVLTTVLGSCVAACIHDPVLKVGGMNHFLLASPGEGARVSAADAERYGAFAMEMLINDLIKLGSHRSNLRAHLYGGASMRAGMHDIGAENGRFAVEFLRRDGIQISKIDLGGNEARRVDFRAASGQTRCRIGGVPQQVRPAPKQIPSGDVELF